MKTDNLKMKKTISPFGYFKTENGPAIRYGFWPCGREEKSGTILLLTGRREFMEKYSETISELNQRKFDVYSKDWRGQGLSDRQLSNPHKGYVGDYGNYLTDLHFLIEHIVSAQPVLPLIAVAHSMGGHIVLRYLHDNPGIIEKAVLLSPMIDIVTTFFSDKMLRIAVRLALKMGFSQAYTIGTGDFNPSDRKFKHNRLTSDPERFLNEQRSIDKNPELALGGVTYGWLDATFKSIDVVRKTGFASAIKTPILMLSAGADRIVSNESQQKISLKISNCIFKTIPDARHEILNERDAIRTVFWNEFDAFVKSDGFVKSQVLLSP